VEAQAALLQLTESLERRVQDRTRELAMANRELESFSYSVSHDLRAPLQVIDGFGQALQNRHRDQLQPQARHYLERIRENTRQMGQLIDDLLALARVTRAVIVPEPIDLAPRARQVIERLRQRFPDREVVVEIDEPMLCSGDPQLLGIVLENLIGNAWKFTARTPLARIHVGLRIDEEGPVYFVSDNGAGFDMTYADKLFKAFQRLHATTEFEGTGVGLATVHRIVTRHGGRVWAESVPGERTTFHFTLYEGGAHEEQPNPAGRGQPGPPGTDADDAGGEQRPE
jgi:light-regulated signal transduction histidine kinase (bacteriophytochrome)